MHARRVCVAWTVAAAALFGIIAPCAAQVPADHVYAFAGHWACRTVEGVIVRQSGSRLDATIVVPTDVERNGKHEQYEDRYEFDPAVGRWHVESGLGGFAAAASPWTSDTWVVQAENADHVPVRMTTELLPGGDFRRTFAYDRGRGSWFAYSVERCTPGTTPPGTGACIAQRYPATTLEAALPVMGSERPSGVNGGKVVLAISLDETSKVTNVRVVSSSAPWLNIPAMAAARASRFRTEIVNCKPLAADYIFTVGDD
jgi:hypothetical protein